MATIIQPPVLVPLPYRRWNATVDIIPPNLSVAVLIAQGQQVGGTRPGSRQFSNYQVKRWTQTPDPVPNSLLTTLSFIQLSVPASQLDWPPPQKAKFLSFDTTVNNYLPLGIVTPVAQPVTPTFGQAFKTFINLPQDPPSLIGTVLPFTNTKPFNLGDFTPPVRRPWSADTFVPNVTLNLPGPSVIQGAVTFTNTWKRYAIENFDPPNTLISAPPNTKPFGLGDWPQPFRAKPIGSMLYVRPETATASFAGSGGTPFYQTDFPPPFKASWRWDPQPPPNLILSLTQPTVIPPMFDSLGARITSWVPQFDVPNLLPTLVSQPNPQPQPLPPQLQVFSHWTNPVDPVTNQLPLGFILPPPPFAQTDWPGPFKTRIEPWDVPTNLSAETFVNVKPFKLTDWPQPFGQRFTPDVPPPGLLTTLQFVVPANPFNQFDWPQVYRKGFTGAILDPPNPFTSVLLPNPKPFNLGDWPQPFVARWNIWVDQLADSPLVTISPTPVPPVPPIPGSGQGREGGSVILQPKKLGETLILAFDFISILAQGEILSSAQVIAKVYSGNDPNPQLMIPTTASIAGTQVLQEITGGVVGTVYELLCIVTTSLARTPEISAYYVVEPDLA